MTRKQAASRVRSIWLSIDPPTDTRHGYVERWFDKDDMKALEMAFKSLEAWDAVIEYIKNYENDCLFTENRPMCRKCYGTMFDAILFIINKQLDEVEDA